ncbi:multicopper oxidase domain-containing protein [Jannaschia ovalis]|uniref:Multicopper oxidase domain-containing protein n=1 Tax=Jannaschia ovalis TaxID=3038773 RepID=A0ABY8LEM1_9RHOB|nr:multicopper oxidase domain-containing protein [Jannaschia sp. GRR-S6-38]WGH78613.1 multicopper oxidase domain-containing protein [Jannaschia sp. GRR-S6-38]
MDGVAGLTQAAVEPGGDFLYDFPLPDAGTYRATVSKATGLQSAITAKISKAGFRRLSVRGSWGTLKFVYSLFDQSVLSAE